MNSCRRSSCADSLTCYRGEAAANLLNLFDRSSCSSGATRAPNVFQFRGPRRQVFVCGVEFGGGESKNLLLSFVRFTTNFRDRTLDKSCYFNFSSCTKSLRVSQELTVFTGLLLPSFSAHSSWSCAIFTPVKRYLPSASEV